MSRARCTLSPERIATRSSPFCPLHLHPYHTRAIGVLSWRIPPQLHSVMGWCHHASKYFDLHFGQVVTKQLRKALPSLRSATAAPTSFCAWILDEEKMLDDRVRSRQRAGATSHAAMRTWVTRGRQQQHPIRDREYTLIPDPTRKC